MRQTSDQQARYSDGEAAERDILAALRSTADVSLESEELMEKVKDIASYYHLGIGRSAILRCLDLPVDSKVLELGAGCGAITRYLGETFSSVRAIEPSPIRAEIARERCRDLENVSISCTDARNEHFDSEYDVVVIIGVLEYAPVFIYPEDAPRDACLRFLKLARSALNENGNQVLAIENRIGLDYWAGAPENHTGRPYDGIHSYPNAGSPVTFTRTELKELLAEAGFDHTAFYYCFPDYHYARTILSSTGEESDFFLHNWVDFPVDSPRSIREPTFNKLLAAKALSESGMLREFANSFLVVSGSQDITDVDWVAKRFDMRRRKPFRIVTTLHVTTKPFVGKTSLHSVRGDTCESSINQVTQQMGDALWRPGHLLTFEIERAALGSEFREYLKILIDKYHRELENHFGTGEYDTEGFPLLKSGSLDAVFSNIIQDEVGNWYFIDEEWQTDRSVPIDFVIYRAIRFCLSRHGIHEGHLKEMIRSLYPTYNRRRHKKNRELADTYQRQTYLNLINPKLFKRSLLGRIVRNDVVRPWLEMVWRRIPARTRAVIRNRL